MSDPNFYQTPGQKQYQRQKELEEKSGLKDAKVLRRILKQQQRETVKQAKLSYQANTMTEQNFAFHFAHQQALFGMITHNQANLQHQLQQCSPLMLPMFQGPPLPQYQSFAPAPPVIPNLYHTLQPVPQLPVPQPPPPQPIAFPATPYQPVYQAPPPPAALQPPPAALHQPLPQQPAPAAAPTQLAPAIQQREAAAQAAAKRQRTSNVHTLADLARQEDEVVSSVARTVSSFKF